MLSASRSLLLAALALVLAAAPAQAQSVSFLPDSKLWIEGTSNKSDWTVEATELKGKVTLGGEASDVEAVEVIVPAAKIVGGRSTIMDRLMHKTLQVTEHPEITFLLTSAESTAEADGDGFALQTKGKLTIAGVTKNIQMRVKGTPAANGTVRYTGSHKLLLTDYDMTPPTAMFGALHTGDEVTVHFDVAVKPKGAAQ